MKLNILFVDDEPNVLDGLRRMFRPLRPEWTAEVAPGGQQALELMARRAFDVVVSDMRMPGMTGVELLEEVRRLYPKTIRIILSGQCDEEASARAVGVAHQMLSKPCDAQVLKATVASACARRDLLVSEPLLSLVTRQDSIPSLPSLYAEVVGELDSAEPSLTRVSAIVGRDPGMSAKILQVANSSFFCVRRPASTPKEAVALLGFETMRMLVLACSVFSRFKAPPQEFFSMEALWSHSRSTGELAGTIAKAEGLDARAADLAVAAGLLHDVGHLILLNALPDAYPEVLARAAQAEEPLWEVERTAFGSSHAEVGACLLGMWGVPAPIVEAVAWHHRPGECPTPGFCPLTAVHAADALLLEESPRPDARPDLAYLGRLNLLDRVERWRKLCGGPAPGGS
jgi:HD-like signal output (HDOD) protein/CheY-like chemotaxis protein